MSWSSPQFGDEVSAKQAELAREEEERQALVRKEEDRRKQAIRDLAALVSLAEEVAAKARLQDPAEVRIALVVYDGFDQERRRRIGNLSGWILKRGEPGYPGSAHELGSAPGTGLALGHDGKLYCYRGDGTVTIPNLRWDKAIHHYDPVVGPETDPDQLSMRLGRQTMAGIRAWLVDFAAQYLS